MESPHHLEEGLEEMIEQLATRGERMRAVLGYIKQHEQLRHHLEACRAVICQELQEVINQHPEPLKAYTWLLGQPFIAMNVVIPIEVLSGLKKPPG